jgi:hypothetical protein
MDLRWWLIMAGLTLGQVLIIGLLSEMAYYAMLARDWAEWQIDAAMTGVILGLALVAVVVLAWAGVTA